MSVNVVDSTSLKMMNTVIHNLPRRRSRFLSLVEANYKAQSETGEVKGHYLNATTGTCEVMFKRAVFLQLNCCPIAGQSAQSINQYQFLLLCMID